MVVRVFVTLDFFLSRSVAASCWIASPLSIWVYRVLRWNNLTPFYSGVQLSSYTFYISPIELWLLWAKITYLRNSSKSLGKMSLYEIDLSNEVLKIYSCQWIAKISEVKFGDQTKICWPGRPWAHGIELGRVSN